MCGIAGIADFAGRPIDESLVRSMCGAIRHRGPDDEGIASLPERPSGGPQAVIGNRRLSIIDVAGGHQPIANEDRTIWTVFNGELYNYQALRARLEAAGHRLATSSDTECLVHLYEDLGEAFVSELEGMFALALWDDRRKKLVLARDRFGKKPLLYAEDGGRLWFGSEFQAILADSVDRPYARSRRARRVPRVHVGAGAADDLQTDPQAAAGARAGPRRGRHARLPLLVALLYAEAAHQRGGCDRGAAAAADRGRAQASDQRRAARRVPERRRRFERGRRDHGRTQLDAGQDVFDWLRRGAIQRAAARTPHRRALRLRAPRVRGAAERGRRAADAGAALRRAVRGLVGDSQLLPRRSSRAST